MDARRCDLMDYIECYRGNVPRLECEREAIATALLQAWRQERYAQVVRLADALAYLAGRRDNASEDERLLRLGIEASRYSGERYHLARFLNRLAGVLWARGQYQRAEQTWQESLEVASALGYGACVWEPFSSFAHVADIMHNYAVIRQFVETLLQAPKLDNPAALIAAIFLRGFYTRWYGELDSAYNDFTYCLNLLSSLPSDVVSPDAAQLFSLEVQAELARAQDEYARAQAYAEAVLSLARCFCDPYTVTALLVDQMWFAYHQGRFDDAHTCALRLLEAARQVEAPHHARCGVLMLQKLSVAGPANSALAGLLSRREREIIQLVAEGLSNREIAERLVITVGTVKKHLEHISTRLDASSRTHAVARARALQIIQ